jgi:agmatinase
LAEKIVVLGARSFSREVFDQVKGSKIEFYPPRDAEKGVGRFLPGEKLYISIDVDVIDPAYAPGVANPEPGGISPYLMTLILSKVIESCDVVALDLVEISPPFDHGDITSILGAWIVKEVMGRILSK